MVYDIKIHAAMNVHHKQNIAQMTWNFPSQPYSFKRIKTRDLSTILPNEDVLEKVRLLLMFYMLPCNQLSPRLKMQVETFEASRQQKYQRLKWMKFKQSLQTLNLTDL